MLKLAEIFACGMVLQHDKPIRVFGEGEGTGRIEFAGESREFSADGKWCVEFPPMPCGGPYTMSAVLDGETVVLDEIMVGEVFLFSGQSNVEFKVREEIAPEELYQNDALLRLHTVTRPNSTQSPMSSDGWMCADTATLKKWSSVAYHTGAALRRLPDYADIAIGVIDCSKGASGIQPWMDEKLFIGDAAAYDNHKTSRPEYEKWNGTGFLYHVMLEKLLPYSLNAVVWYQGESNSRPDEAGNYRAMLELMIADWRHAFADENLPFYAVIIPDYKLTGTPEAWAMVQKQLSDAPAIIRGVYTVKSADICEDDNIHPPTKWKLGARLAACIAEKKMSCQPEILFDERLLVGESPVWDDVNKALYFVDIRGKCYYRMDYTTKQCEKVDVPQLLGCLALCKNGDLLLSMEDGVYRRTPDGTLTLAHQPVKLKGDRFNDGKLGPDGCYYVGTAGENFSGAFYRLKDGELCELFDGCGCSNGLDWSGDSKTMYYCDTHEQKLEKFAFSADSHALSARETVCEIPKYSGGGDGLCIDAEGNLWVAIWGGYCVKHIEAATGRVLDVVPIPARQVSSCCFAGEDLRDLIITTAAVRTEEADQPLAGRVFRIRTDVPGVKTNRYEVE